MGRSGFLFITQLCICVALAASAALYVHYLSPLDSGYCGPSSGCEAARRSGLSYFFGSRFVSLPLFSLVAFGGLLALSVRRPSAQTGPGEARGFAALWNEPSIALFAASGLGAIIGLGLMGYQAFVLQQFCWLCMIVDIAAVGAALFAFLAARSRHGAEPAASPLHEVTWAAVAALIIGGPLVWDAIKPPPAIPSSVAALQQPGKINVIELADFECPYCRRLHTTLKPLLAEYGEAVHFVRVHYPLPQHPNADHAARAAICATKLGQGEAMADRLFELTLSPEAIARAAQSLGLDPVAFDRCLESPATEATLTGDMALLPEGELRGLPTTYVGQKQFVGVPTEAALRDALERAKSKPTPAPSGTLFAALLIGAIGLVGYFGRRRGP
jgi:protein-disulfide isomerase